MSRLALPLLLLACACRWGPERKPLYEPRGPPDPSSQRTLRDGAIVGYADARDTYAWLGIPYAAPPTGPLRWRAPRPVQPWQGAREALRFGEACLQIGNPI